MKLFVPDLMKHRALQLGAVGRSWLDNLADHVAQVASRWQLEIEEQLSGGTEALVFATIGAAGASVLKIGIPGSMRGELTALRVGGGRGYAALLDSDVTHEAILIERLGSRLADSGVSMTNQIETICDTLKLAWQPADQTEGLKSGAEKAQAQADYIQSQWLKLEGACSPAIIKRALDFASQRKAAHSDEASYLIHGDAHIWNTLESSASPTGYKFVDPEGLYGERAIDLAISLREWREVLLKGDSFAAGRKRCELLSQLTGVEVEPIWQWGFIEHVSCGLLDLNLNDRVAADMHFTIAERWLAD